MIGIFGITHTIVWRKVVVDYLCNIASSWQRYGTAPPHAALTGNSGGEIEFALFQTPEL